jgi:hypothetical protein
VISSRIQLVRLCPALLVRRLSVLGADAAWRCGAGAHSHGRGQKPQPNAYSQTRSLHRQRGAVPESATRRRCPLALLCQCYLVRKPSASSKPLPSGFLNWRDTVLQERSIGIVRGPGGSVPRLLLAIGICRYRGDLTSSDSAGCVNYNIAFSHHPTGGGPH